MAKREFSLSRKIFMILEAVVLLPLIYIIAYLCPYHKIFNFSRKIGQMLSTSPKISVIKKNLAIVFPDKDFTDKEIKDITEIMSGYELRIILEMVALGRMSFQQKLQYLRIDDPSHFSRFFHEKPFIGITLHYGNWEFFGNILNELGFCMGVLVERQFNFMIDSYLQKLRHRLYIPTIYNEISQMKPLFQFLKNNSVGIVADQTYWFDPLFIPFFNKEAAVPSGAASLVLKTKLPIFYGFTQYDKNGVYVLSIEPPIEYQITSDKRADLEQIMKSVYERFENTIKLDVSNWYTLGSDRWGFTRELLAEWKKNPDSSRF